MIIHWPILGTVIPSSEILKMQVTSGPITRTFVADLKLRIDSKPLLNFVRGGSLRPQIGSILHAPGAQGYCCCSFGKAPVMDVAPGPVSSQVHGGLPRPKQANFCPGTLAPPKFCSIRPAVLGVRGEVVVGRNFAQRGLETRRGSDMPGPASAQLGLKLGKCS